jgi:hypothetical protein
MDLWAEGMIAAVCAGSFLAKPSCMGCRNCDFTDLREANRWGGLKGRTGILLHLCPEPAPPE